MKTIVDFDGIARLFENSHQKSRDETNRSVYFKIENRLLDHTSSLIYVDVIERVKTGLPEYDTGR